jgi:hypothetical protein
MCRNRRQLTLVSSAEATRVTTSTPVKLLLLQTGRICLPTSRDQHEGQLLLERRRTPLANQDFNTLYNRRLRLKRHIIISVPTSSRTLCSCECGNRKTRGPSFLQVLRYYRCTLLLRIFLNIAQYMSQA